MIYLLLLPLFFIMTLIIVEIIMYKNDIQDQYIVGLLKDAEMTTKDKIRGSITGLIFSPFMIIHLITLKGD